MTNLTDDAVFADGQLDGSQLSIAMLRNSPDCIKILNTSGRIGFMSENGLCAMEFQSTDEVAGKTWWELWPQEQQTALREAFDRAMEGQIGLYWGQCPTAAGTVKEWDVRISPIPEADGTIRSILAVSRDVTQT